MAVTAAVAVLAAAGSVWAWGDVGHKVVCEIAFHELTDHARAEVVRLIKKDTEFKAFSDSCVWPDHPKQRETEHYINVPRDFRAFVAAESARGVEAEFEFPAERAFPVAMVAGHGLLAVTTFTLVLLTVLGVGGS